jgi:hypothetical protein
MSYPGAHSPTDSGSKIIDHIYASVRPGGKLPLGGRTGCLRLSAVKHRRATTTDNRREAVWQSIGHIDGTEARKENRSF